MKFAEIALPLARAAPIANTTVEKQAITPTIQITLPVATKPPSKIWANAGEGFQQGKAKPQLLACYFCECAARQELPRM
jgi:hypothetical protein